MQCLKTAARSYFWGYKLWAIQSIKFIKFGLHRPHENHIKRWFHILVAPHYSETTFAGGLHVKSYICLYV